MRVAIFFLLSVSSELMVSIGSTLAPTHCIILQTIDSKHFQKTVYQDIEFESFCNTYYGISDLEDSYLLWQLKQQDLKKICQKLLGPFYLVGYGTP